MYMTRGKRDTSTLKFESWGYIPLSEQEDDGNGYYYLYRLAMLDFAGAWRAYREAKRRFRVGIPCLGAEKGSCDGLGGKDGVK